MDRAPVTVEFTRLFLRALASGQELDVVEDERVAAAKLFLELAHRAKNRTLKQTGLTGTEGSNPLVSVIGHCKIAMGLGSAADR